MTTDPDALRAEIRKLVLRHARGDIREKHFQVALAERTVELYRAFVRGFVSNGETILHEHHVVFSHTKLTQSMLKEPEQQAVSLFATDRRIFRLRSTLMPERPVTCDEQDNTVVDAVPYESIQSLHVRRQIRPGEIGAGFVILCVAFLFRSWLSITGPLLMLLGALGILHGLLLPTRWIEIRTGEPVPAEPVRIHGLRKKSARRLLKFLRGKVLVT